MDHPSKLTLNDDLKEIRDRLIDLQGSFGWIIFCIFGLNICALAMSIYLVLNAAGGGILASLISIILMVVFTVCLHVDYMLDKNIKAIISTIAAHNNSQKEDQHDANN